MRACQAGDDARIGRAQLARPALREDGGQVTRRLRAGFQIVARWKNPHYGSRSASACPTHREMESARRCPHATPEIAPAFPAYRPSMAIKKAAPIVGAASSIELSDLAFVMRAPIRTADGELAERDTQIHTFTFAGQRRRDRAL